MISMNATLEDLKELELCYSPYYSTAKDVVNHTALVGLNLLHDKFRQVPVYKVRAVSYTHLDVYKRQVQLQSLQIFEALLRSE